MMPMVTALQEVRDKLGDVEQALGSHDRLLRRLEQVTRRQRIMLWAGVVVFLIVLVIGVLVHREGQVRVDAIQDSRFAACESTEEIKRVLAQRDKDLVEIAARLADSPELVGPIIAELESLPAHEALDPLDCEALIYD